MVQKGRKDCLAIWGKKSKPCGVGSVPPCKPLTSDQAVPSTASPIIHKSKTYHIYKKPARLCPCPGTHKTTSFPCVVSTEMGWQVAMEEVRDRTQGSRQRTPMPMEEWQGKLVPCPHWTDGEPGAQRGSMVSLSEATLMDRHMETDTNSLLASWLPSPASLRRGDAFEACSPSTLWSCVLQCWIRSPV